jgi:hypothetical protein
MQIQLRCTGSLFARQAWSRRKRRRSIASWLVLAFVAAAANSETVSEAEMAESRGKISSAFSGQQLIVVADEKTRDDAITYAKALQASLKENAVNLEPSVMLSTLGSFAISIGSLPSATCNTTVSELVTKAIAPKGTFCSYPERFVALFRLDGDALIPLVGQDFTAIETEREQTLTAEFMVATPEDITRTAQPIESGDHKAVETDRYLADMQDFVAHETYLGETLVELGPLSESGFWLYSELVDTILEGMVKDVTTGATLVVELRPLRQEQGAMDLLSLEAMLELNLLISEQSFVQVFVPVASDPVDRSATEESLIAVPMETEKIPAQAEKLNRPFVQIGTFRVEGNAIAARDRMQRVGLSALVKLTKINNNDFWRVIVGPVADNAARVELLEQVHSLGFRDAFAVQR